MSDTEASRIPQVENPLSEQVLQHLRAAAEAAVEDVSRRYSENLTEQVALLQLEVDQLREEKRLWLERAGLEKS